MNMKHVDGLEEEYIVRRTTTNVWIEIPTQSVWVKYYSSSSVYQ